MFSFFLFMVSIYFQGNDIYQVMDFNPNPPVLLIKTAFSDII